eukprot:TRINITY_DN8515_c0_g1_i1.p1 TRINITY_DN8515_c0_g1~~TRINITY_DN8515_c0_g1_i1.p1  ORF type:complete len:365 (-),score=69.58 TRINITY_DN8515_c0_g1_i1:76-1170(-)
MDTQEKFMSDLVKWAQKNKIELTMDKLGDIMSEFIKTLPLEQQLELQKDRFTKDEPLDLSLFLKKLRRLEKNTKNPDKLELAYISNVCFHETNMEIAFDNGTHNVMMEIMRNTKNDQIFELAFWTLTELNLNPHNSVRLYSNEILEFIVPYLDTKYPPIINGFVMKMLADFINYMYPDQIIKYLKMIVPKHVYQKNISLRSYYELDGKLFEQNTNADFVYFSLRYIVNVSKNMGYKEEEFLNILHKIPLSQWKVYATCTNNSVSSFGKLVYMIVDPVGSSNITSTNDLLGSVNYLSQSSSMMQEKFHTSPNITAQKKCKVCDVVETLTLKMKSCSRCKKVSYCSKECQLKHWPEHKKECKPHTK